MAAIAAVYALRTVRRRALTASNTGLILPRRLDRKTAIDVRRLAVDRLHVVRILWRRFTLCVSLRCQEVCER
jgi:hypothetical protein